MLPLESVFSMPICVCPTTVESYAEVEKNGLKTPSGVWMLMEKGLVSGLFFCPAGSSGFVPLLPVPPLGAVAVPVPPPVPLQATKDRSVAAARIRQSRTPGNRLMLVFFMELLLSDSGMRMDSGDRRRAAGCPRRVQFFPRVSRQQHPAGQDRCNHSRSRPPASCRFPQSMRSRWRWARWQSHRSASLSG